MYKKLKVLDTKERQKVNLPLSKSIANRLLVAQHLSNNELKIGEYSDAEDTILLRQALSNDSALIDVGMAGTAFRFLTAYYAISEGERILTGEERMKERPVRILVDALLQLGAKIEYLAKEGYPPLKIKGRKLKGGRIEVDSSVSSQYITALLLIAPYLEGGLSIKLNGKKVSSPYIQMTISLMKRLNISINSKENYLEVEEGDYWSNKEIAIERDWSSAAFFYQLTTIGGKELELPGLFLDSVQGDVDCAGIFQKLGVKTISQKGGVCLKPETIQKTDFLELDLEATPDLIPSVAVTASLLIEKTVIKGIKTLRIKESDRVEALKLELAKLDVTIQEKENEITIRKPSVLRKGPVKFNSYNDHRIAMCLAPLIYKLPDIHIENPEVVKKSFPDFWNQLKKFGIQLED